MTNAFACRMYRVSVLLLLGPAQGFSLLRAAIQEAENTFLFWRFQLRPTSALHLALDSTSPCDWTSVLFHSDRSEPHCRVYWAEPVARPISRDPTLPSSKPSTSPFPQMSLSHPSLHPSLHPFLLLHILMSPSPASPRPLAPPSGHINATSPHQ